MKVSDRIRTSGVPHQGLTERDRYSLGKLGDLELQSQPVKKNIDIRG